MPRYTEARGGRLQALDAAGFLPERIGAGSRTVRIDRTHRVLPKRKCPVCSGFGPIGSDPMG